MIGAPPAAMVARPQITYVDRAAAWLATGATAWVLFEFGRGLMASADPVAPVSFLTSTGPIVLTALKIAAIAAACGGLAMLVAGRSLADGAPFAVFFGLVVLSFQGQTSEYFLLDRASQQTGTAALAWSFLAESLIWLAVCAGAVLAAALVTRWRYGGSSRTERWDDGGVAPLLSAANDCPKLWRRSAGETSDCTPPDMGVKHMAVVTVAGVFSFLILSIGATTRVIEHGQAVFTVAASVSIACYIGFHVAPVRSALWSMGGAALLVLIAYLWAAFRPANPGLPPTVPASPFLRILPIQFVSVGLAAAIATTWYRYRPYDRETASQPSRP